MKVALVAKLRRIPVHQPRPANGPYKNTVAKTAL